MALAHKGADHHRNGSSPPVSGTLLLQHSNNQHKHAPPPFSSFVRMPIGCLVLVGCLMIISSTPSRSLYHAYKENLQPNLHGSMPSTSSRREGAAELQRYTSAAEGTAKMGEYANIDLELPSLPTLQAELDRSEVVVLYFAAKWCTMSTPITRLIDDHLMPALVDNAKLPAEAKRPFSLIYVSSDNTKAQYKNYNHMRAWTRVPFQSPERKYLKRYFKVCAKKEMEKLELQREHELPFLVVMSGKTHQVVSKRGVEELKRHKKGTLVHWVGLVRAQDNSGVGVY